MSRPFHAFLISENAKLNNKRQDSHSTHAAARDEVRRKGGLVEAHITVTLERDFNVNLSTEKIVVDDKKGLAGTEYNYFVTFKGAQRVILTNRITVDAEDNVIIDGNEWIWQAQKSKRIKPTTMDGLGNDLDFGQAVAIVHEI